MSNAPTVHIDAEAFWTDPYPVLAQMRAETPICYVPELGATLLTKRDDIHTCEKNVKVFSSDQPGGLMNVLMGRNMMRKDGEEHRRERFVYYPAISPSRVGAYWTEQFDRLAEKVLDGLEGRGQLDLVPEYATALSGEALKIITGLTNITFEQMDSWSQGMIDGVANYGGDPAVEARCHQATAAIDAAIDQRLVELEHEAGVPGESGEPNGPEPEPSLLTAMLGSGMPMEQVRANIKLTISGGQNEPRDAIAGAAWALLTHPDQLALAQAGTVPWRHVFEEYARWISPIGMSPRRIAQPHSFGGVEFEPEDRVFFMFSSANRDEDHFDHADLFDITRDVGPSLAFGAGPHFCAGAAASRSLIGDVALPRLFERLPNLRLNRDTDPVRFGGWAFRGPLNVGVTWDTSNE